MSPYKDSDKSWNSWSDQMVIRFRYLYSLGLPHSQIAREMGGGITRNACIGKAHRLGLPGRGQSRGPYKRKGEVKAKPRKRPAPQRRMERPDPSSKAQEVENPPQEFLPPETHHRKPPPPPPLIPRITPTLRAEPVPLEARVKREWLGVPLLDIVRDQCRYIEGEVTANTPMCGQPTWPGSSYCAYHHTICWSSSPPRQRRAAFAGGDGWGERR